MRTIENRVKEYNAQNPNNRLQGFGRVKCLELSAAFELGYRRQRLSPDDLHNVKVKTAEDAYTVLRPYFATDDEQENVFVLPLDADRRSICEPFLVSRGMTAWTRCEQMHLVRLDFKRFWVSAQPNRETREVTDSHF